MVRSRLVDDTYSSDLLNPSSKLSNSAYKSGTRDSFSIKTKHSSLSIPANIIGFYSCFRRFDKFRSALGVVDNARIEIRGY